MLSLEKAYLLGVYIGDGYAQWNKDDPAHCSYQLVIPSIDLDLLNKTERCIIRSFPELEDRVKYSEEPRTGKTKGVITRLVCHSKRLCRFLRKKTNVKQKLPKISDPLVFKEFTAGLMDTDGWITEWKNKTSSFQYQMGFATTLPWYEEFKKRMQHHGVQVGKLQEQVRYNDNWNPCYRMYFNIASFVSSGFYFTIKRKQDRLERWQKRIGV